MIAAMRPWQWIQLTVGLVIAGGLLLYMLTGWPSAQQVTVQRPAATRTAAATRATTRPRLIPKKVLEVPLLASPTDIGAATDARIGGLVESLNRRQDRLTNVALKGDCVWAFDG